MIMKKHIDNLLALEPDYEIKSIGVARHISITEDTPYEEEYEFYSFLGMMTRADMKLKGITPAAIVLSRAGDSGYYYVSSVRTSEGTDNVIFRLEMELDPI